MTREPQLHRVRLGEALNAPAPGQGSAGARLVGSLFERSRTPLLLSGVFRYQHHPRVFRCSRRTGCPTDPSAKRSPAVTLLWGRVFKPSLSAQTAVPLRLFLLI